MWPKNPNTAANFSSPESVILTHTHHVFVRRTRGVDVTRRRMEFNHVSFQTTVKL